MPRKSLCCKNQLLLPLWLCQTETQQNRQQNRIAMRYNLSSIIHAVFYNKPQGMFFLHIPNQFKMLYKKG